MKLGKKGKSLNGRIRVPGDKSNRCRSIMFGGLARAFWYFEVRMSFLMQVFRDLGVKIEEWWKTIQVHGVGFDGLKAPDNKLGMGGRDLTASFRVAGQDFTAEMFWGW